MEFQIFCEFGIQNWVIDIECNKMLPFPNVSKIHLISIAKKSDNITATWPPIQLSRVAIGIPIQLLSK